GAREGLPGRRRPGAGVGDAECGEVREDDCLPAQPAGAAAADEQPRGADQPAAALLREGALQVAAAADGGAPPGAGVGAVAAAPQAQPRQQAGESPQAPAAAATPASSQPGAVRLSRSARSLENTVDHHPCSATLSRAPRAVFVIRL